MKFWIIWLSISLILCIGDSIRNAINPEFRKHYWSYFIRNLWLNPLIAFIPALIIRFIWWLLFI